VNAPVDEGIAVVVVALNQIDGVVTLDSCQRGVTGEAYVYFTYGDNWRELGKLLERLAAQLRTMSLCCGFSLSLEWFGSNDQPRARLVLRPEHATGVANAIQPV
jgi:hypothetical protein